MKHTRKSALAVTLIVWLTLVASSSSMLGSDPPPADPPTEPTEPTEPCPDPNGDMDDGQTPIFGNCGESLVSDGIVTTIVSLPQLPPRSWF